mmetsp:Transcript_27225/g.58019  ORF Transcript_27225/g.58019 Transcript_27225/m.58019 type:complete len:86 (-) Transcript_27225:142-399(-)
MGCRALRGGSDWPVPATGAYWGTPLTTGGPPDDPGRYRPGETMLVVPIVRGGVGAGMPGNRLAVGAPRATDWAPTRFMGMDWACG